MTEQDTPDTAARDRQTSVDHGHLRELIRRSLSAEFTSIRDGKPVTYPLTPFYDDETRRVVVSSPPAFAGKVENVRGDPRVALLLHDEDGEYLVTGDGHLREGDPETNAEYVRSLITSEPKSAKRNVYAASVNFIESWIGRRLMGWYGLRIVVEIDPRSMDRVADPSSIDALPAWAAVGMSDPEASSYERAILSTVGDDDSPAMQPITALGIREDAAVLESPPVVPVEAGQPACLLLHWHDDRVASLGQRVVRCRYRTDEGSLLLVPGSSFELTVDGPLDRLRFIIDGKRRTKAYFDK